MNMSNELEQKLEHIAVVLGRPISRYTSIYEDENGTITLDCFTGLRMNYDFSSRDENIGKLYEKAKKISDERRDAALADSPFFKDRQVNKPHWYFG